MTGSSTPISPPVPLQDLPLDQQALHVFCGFLVLPQPSYWPCRWNKRAKSSAVPRHRAVGWPGLLFSSLCLSEALKDEVRKALQKEDYSTSERIRFKKKGKGSLKQLLQTSQIRAVIMIAPNPKAARHVSLPMLRGVARHYKNKGWAQKIARSQAFEVGRRGQLFFCCCSLTSCGRLQLSSSSG